MFCENCGTKLPDNSQFCQECGYKVPSTENETQVNESRSSVQRGPVPPVMRTTAPQQTSEPYKKTPRQPSEPYVKKVPRQPSETYREETVNSQNYEPYGREASDIISFGQYVLMIFLAGIPIINIILMVKWGFSSKQNPNKRNFAKALLFYYLIAVIIYVAYIWLWLKATSSI